MSVFFSFLAHRANTRRVRYQVSSASPLNFQAEAAKLEELIKQYNLD